MALKIEKATKVQRKLRMSLMGPSGSGKTFTALKFAKELAEGDKVVLIDTERQSASLYSDLFNFDVINLPSSEPELYMEAIALAREAKAKVLVIDSLSHAWMGEGGVLDRVNAASGNKFTDGWGKIGTPLQNKLINAILDAPMHVITTMRVKTEYVVEQNDRGKSAPKRVGLSAVQRDGVEYEMDIVGNMSIDNVLTIEKTRMADLSGKIIPKPDGQLAKQILDWLNAGEAAPNVDREALVVETLNLYEKMGTDEIKLAKMSTKLRLKTSHELVEIVAEARAKFVEFEYQQTSNVA
jgi:hypothetical protein